MNQSNKQKPKIFTAHYIFLLLFFLVIFIHLFRPNSHFFIPAKCLSLFQSELISSLLAFFSNIYCTAFIDIYSARHISIFSFYKQTTKTFGGPTSLISLNFGPNLENFKPLFLQILLPCSQHTHTPLFFPSGTLMTQMLNLLLYIPKSEAMFIIFSIFLCQFTLSISYCAFQVQDSFLCPLHLAVVSIQ